jgi:hypothetical protein
MEFHGKFHELTERFSPGERGELKQAKKKMSAIISGTNNQSVESEVTKWPGQRV